MSETKRILVCGATGYLGKHVVRTAAADGHSVRALVRDPARLGDVAACCAEVFVGQATQPETLEGLCDDVDVVFSALGNRTLRRAPTIWEVDRDANLNIVRKAWAAESVEQIVFVSVLGGPEVRKRVPQIEAREQVADAIVAGAKPWTIVRPSGFFNDMSEIFEMARKGRVWIPGDGNVPFNPIHGADLARVCVDQFGREAAYGAHIDAGGPDILTFRDIGRLCFEALGIEGRITALPLWSVRALGTVVRPFNINVASLILMMTAFADSDATTDRYGTHHLADFFAALAEGRDPDLAISR